MDLILEVGIGVLLGLLGRDFFYGFLSSVTNGHPIRWDDNKQVFVRRWQFWLAKDIQRKFGR